MDVRYTVGRNEYKRMTTAELRDAFQIDLFESGKLNLLYCEGERGIVEVRFPFTGDYMFHAHKTEFAERGWMGFFRVLPDDDTQLTYHGNQHGE